MDKPVRMHSGECDKAGIAFNAGEIPGGCTLIKLKSVSVIR